MIAILRAYAQPINKQNAATAIRQAGRLSFLGRLGARQTAVMTLEMLFTWHQQRAGEYFAILARATHMPNGEAIHIDAVRLLQAFESHGQK